MKHLISEPNKTVIAVGDTYSTAVDDLDKTRTVHVIDGHRYDQNFVHESTTALPSDFFTGLYKFVDGAFVKIVDKEAEVRQNGYDEAVRDIYFGGNE